jgi:hypothetical protein
VQSALLRHALHDVAPTPTELPDTPPSEEVSQGFAVALEQAAR